MQPHKTERLHALDSLRAIMMLLGLVLHAAITYSEKDYGATWFLKDSATVHISLEYIVALIHIFRMPIFFIVSGFFGAMLFYERSPRKMIKNRMDRIVYPFIVFLFILWPTIKFSFGYTYAVFAGSPTPMTNALAPFSDLSIFIPPQTFHLWFLYYLALITIVTFGLGLLFKKLPSLSYKIHLYFSWVFKKPITRLVFFSGLTFVILMFFEESWVNTSTSYIPNLNIFIFYFFFYIVGWVLFKSKHLLNEMMRFDWLSTILALILFQFRFSMSLSLSLEIIMLINAITVWLFFFGISGLFLRYGSKYSLPMRYISDSSYWVYLIHLSLIAFIPGLIAHWSIPAFAKFLIVFSVTIGFCVVTYHYFVRSTFIGKFLNGRKYP